MTINSHRRLRSETTDISIRFKDASGEERCHDLAVCLAVDGRGHLRELNFVTRGKIGSGLDDMLKQLGIQISRVIQGRDPSGEAETGAAL